MNKYLAVFKEGYTEDAQVVIIYADTENSAVDLFWKWANDNNVYPYDYEFELVSFEDIEKANIINKL